MHIVTPSEQTAEKSDLCLLRRSLRDRHVQQRARRSRIAFGKGSPFQPQSTYLVDKLIAPAFDLGEFSHCRLDQAIDVYETSHINLFGLTGKKAIPTDELMASELAFYPEGSGFTGEGEGVSPGRIAGRRWESNPQPRRPALVRKRHSTNGAEGPGEKTEAGTGPLGTLSFRSQLKGH